MNSRKRRFWQVWDKRNLKLAETNLKEANRIRENKCRYYLSIKQGRK